LCIYSLIFLSYHLSIPFLTAAERRGIKPPEIKKYGQIFNAYLKECAAGAVIYFEEVLNSKKNKSLRSKTMYKKIGKVSNKTFLKIVSNNANTDISEAKTVVGAGGHPGGEAE
jgi:hypothetical protein